jgi:sec-independent protein translocase protein TatB
MLDLAWSEIALIGVVALVVIGPKDLPEAIRGVARGVQKLRRMASEFQGHADELVREAKLDEVRNQINEVRSAVNEIRNFDLRTEIEKNVDADGSIRKTFEDDPFKTTGSGTDWANPPPVVTTPPPEAMEGASAGVAPEAPAFIPPAFIPPAAVSPPPVAAAPPPPAFVPPATPEPVPVPAAPLPPPLEAAAPAPVAAAVPAAPAHTKV